MSVWEYDPKKRTISNDDFKEMMKKGIKPEMVTKAIKTINASKLKIPAGLIPGPPCPHCQTEFYIRTGVCLTCSNCGESSSCG